MNNKVTAVLACFCTATGAVSCHEPGPVHETRGMERQSEKQKRSAPAKTAAVPESLPRQNASALPPADPSTSALFHAAYQRVEDDWQQVLFLCDGVAGDRVILITTPDAAGLSTLWAYSKTDFRTERQFVRVGIADPGAGTVTFDLSTPKGEAVGSVHSINPGMRAANPAPGLPTLSSIRIDDSVTRCRWLDRAQVMLATPNRTVWVVSEGGGFRYLSFDYAKPGAVEERGPQLTSSATVSIAHGAIVPAKPNHQRYEFHAGPWTYRVDASADNRAPGASITVLKEGRVVRTTVVAAYQMSGRRVE